MIMIDGFRDYPLSWQASGSHRLRYTTSSDHILNVRGIVIGIVGICSPKFPQVFEKAWDGEASFKPWAATAKVGAEYSLRRNLLSFLDTVFVGQDFAQDFTIRQWTDNIQGPGKKDKALSLLGSCWAKKFLDEATTKQFPPPQNYSEEEQDRIADLLMIRACLCSRGSRRFRTDTNYIGSGADGMREGDLVCIVNGAQVPFVLRPFGKNGKFKFIGDAYVHGGMEGQAMKLGLEERDFLLI